MRWRASRSVALLASCRASTCDLAGRAAPLPGAVGHMRELHVVVEVEGGEHEHVRAGLGAADDASRRLDPVEPRHADVHENDVRSQAARLVDRLLPVAGLAHDVDVGLGAQDHAQAVAHEPLIVGEQDAHRGHVAVSSGSVARTAKPPPGWAALSTWPPKSSARSRMPTSPWPRPPATAAGAAPRPLSVISSSRSRVP